MNRLKKIDENILRLSENSLVKLPFFGDPKYNLIDNCHTLNAAINFVLRSCNIIWPYCFLKCTVNECNLYC